MDVLTTLKAEAVRLRSDLARVQKAIAALNGTGSYGRDGVAAKSTSARPKRKLSAAGRARIVAALKARWSKVKAAKKKAK
jgi:hypothetical protein